MPIYALGDLVPQIDATAFVHPDAVVIGAVVIGPLASIWPSAVLRGDNSRIIVGAQTSIQDGAVLHCTAELETIVGERCVVGHLAHLEGCRVSDDVLIGSGAIVLHRAEVNSWALVGAGALIPNDFEVPCAALAIGIPATLRLGAANRELISESAAHYVEKCRRYRAELRRID